MIRIWLENGKPALFLDDEQLTVCEDIVNGEYILGEWWCTAHELWKRWTAQYRSNFQYVFLSDCDDLAPAAEGNGPMDIFRIVRVEQMSDELPDFLKA